MGCGILASHKDTKYNCKQIKLTFSTEIGKSFTFDACLDSEISQIKN